MTFEDESLILLKCRTTIRRLLSTHIIRVLYIIFYIHLASRRAERSLFHIHFCPFMMDYIRKSREKKMIQESTKVYTVHNMCSALPNTGRLWNDPSLYHVKAESSLDWFAEWGISRYNGNTGKQFFHLKGYENAITAAWIMCAGVEYLVLCCRSTGLGFSQHRCLLLRESRYYSTALPRLVGTQFPLSPARVVLQILSVRSHLPSSPINATTFQTGGSRIHILCLSNSIFCTLALLNQVIKSCIIASLLSSPYWWGFLSCPSLATASAPRDSPCTRAPSAIVILYLRKPASHAGGSSFCHTCIWHFFGPLIRTMVSPVLSILQGGYQP